MGHFPHPLRAELQPDRNTWRLLAPCVFLDADHGAIEAPPGTATDFASIRTVRSLAVVALAVALLGSLLPWAWLSAPAYALGLLALLLYAAVAGYGHEAAAVHDWLYRTGLITRRQADAVFYRALRASGVARWRAWLMWAGVRLGGWRRYGQSG